MQNPEKKYKIIKECHFDNKMQFPLIRFLKYEKKRLL